ncbi:hypothetical protein [Herbaspirillum lusitanum]|uniref:hypothetical protein n=1 Tax=Herbaspirillum lusitanum TaxID=213312 RepID=UPI0002DDAD68|nr:hypothetical protein [Herbaspirillum lusitanum]
MTGLPGEINEMSGSGKILRSFGENSLARKSILGNTGQASPAYFPTTGEGFDHEKF